MHESLTSKLRVEDKYGPILLFVVSTFQQEKEIKVSKFDVVQFNICIFNVYHAGNQELYFQQCVVGRFCHAAFRTPNQDVG